MRLGKAPFRAAVCTLSLCRSKMESAHRTSLAKGKVGVREKKAKPKLSQFIRERFEPWARGTFEKSSPKTWRDYYKVGVKTILNYKPLADAALDEITSEMVAAFAAHRHAQGRQVSTVNSSLQIVRRMLRLAVEWGVSDSAVPMIRMMPGERHREHVVTVEEEARYLAAAPELVANVAAVLVDSGLRPEECFRLRWEAITWSNGRHGTQGRRTGEECLEPNSDMLSPRRDRGGSFVTLGTVRAPAGSALTPLSPNTLPTFAPGDPYKPPTGWNGCSATSGVHATNVICTISIAET